MRGIGRGMIKERERNDCERQFRVLRIDQKGFKKRKKKEKVCH